MTELVDYTIQAGNPIMGSSRFFTLRLPPEWNLSAGAGRPEVNASHERREVKWVVNGDFWYILYDTERRWAMEFVGRLRPFTQQAFKSAVDHISVGGHPAEVHWESRRRGLPWQRHAVTYMTVAYDCPYSERRITLEFSGRCPEDGLREMLSALQSLVCH